MLYRSLQVPDQWPHLLTCLMVVLGIHPWIFPEHHLNMPSGELRVGKWKSSRSPGLSKPIIGGKGSSNVE